MEEKTGDYWQDLNLEVFEALSKIGKSPKINQKRDLSLFLMHVLESENGIIENDLRYRTNLKDPRFLAMKEILTQAGLIRSDMNLNVLPTERVRYLVRKIYYSQNGNNILYKKEALTIPDDAEIVQRGSAAVIRIPDREKTQLKDPVKVKPAPERKKNIVPEKEIKSAPKSTPNKEIAYLVIINKAQVNEIRQHFTDKNKIGLDLETLFQKWKIPYSEASIERLKMYLRINDIDFTLAGNFPKIKMFCKNQNK